MQLIKYGLILLLITANTAFAKPMPPGGGRTADLPSNILFHVENRADLSMHDTYNKVSDINIIHTGKFIIDSEKKQYIRDSHRTIKQYESNGTYIKSIDRKLTAPTCNPNMVANSLEIDSEDNIWIANEGDQPRTFGGCIGIDIVASIYKYDRNGNILTRINRNDLGIDVSFDWINYRIDVDRNDNIYIHSTAAYGSSGSTTYRHKVNVFDKNGNHLKSSDAIVQTLMSAIVVNSHSDMYLVGRNNTIYKYDSSFNLIKQITLSSNVSDGEHTDIDSNDNIYIQTGNARFGTQSIEKYDKDLNLIYKKEFHAGEYPDVLDTISDIFIDRSTDEIYGLLHGIGVHSSIIKLNTDFVYQSTVMPPKYTMYYKVLKLINRLITTTDIAKNANLGMMFWGSPFSDMDKMLVQDMTPAGAAEIVRLTSGDTIPRELGVERDAYYHYSDDLNHATWMLKKYFVDNNPQTDICQRMAVVTIGGTLTDISPWDTKSAYINGKYLYDNLNIQSYFVNVNDQIYPSHKEVIDEVAKVSGTYPDSPIYTRDVDEIYRMLKIVFEDNSSLRYTFTSPIIITNELGEDYIYHTVFDYQDNGQWKGRLRKFKAEVDGGVGALEWDAGEVLDATPPDSRKIWTKSNSLPNSYNNFSVANVNNLKTLLGYSSNSSATSFIRFVRGYDSYDENQNGSTIDSRWKLGDIYHSQLVLQEAPNGFISPDEGHFEGYYRHTHNYQDFINTHKNRNSTVFVGANDGMLHAFSAQSGEELWGFVPPNIINTIKEMDESGIASNSSESIFAVDGKIALKDIYTGGRWKSVLMVGLGQGGKGYFALDVTDETAPEFMFAFLNDVDAEKVYYWDNSGAKTEYTYASVPAQFDYSKLGLATSKPHIINIKQGSSRKWVAIVGGGENDGVRNTYAQGLLVLDLENDGKVLENISLTDRTNDIINAVPNQLTLISGDTTNVANYKGYMGYITDYEGKTWKLDLTDNGTMFETTILYDVEARKTNGRYGSNKLTPSISKELNLWSYFGTGDKVNIESPSQNKILGLKDDEFPIFNIAEIPNASLKNAAIGCPATSEKGWYWDLGNDAKVTGKVAIVEGLVYVPVYTPDPSSECRTGYASIRIYDMSCGELIDDIDVVRGVPGDIIAHKDKLYMSVSKREEKGELPIKNSDGDEIGEVEENIAVIQAITSNNKKLQIKNWKEVR